MKIYNFLFLQTNCTCYLAILLYPAVKNSTSVADSDLQIKGEGGGGGLKIFLSFWSKNKGKGGRAPPPPSPSPGSATELNTVIVEFPSTTDKISIFRKL